MMPNYLHSDDDQLLLQGLRSDSRGAFDGLYHKYWKEVFNTAYKRIKDADKAEDIAQDIFTQLWFRRKDLHICNLRRYLYTAIKNNIFTMMSKESRYVPVNELHLEIKSEGSNADVEILRKDFMKAYEALVNALPAQQKAIFRMRFHQELTTEQIAFELHLSPKTVRNHLGRAITTLRASMMISIFLLTVCK